MIRYLYASHVDGHLFDSERRLSQEELFCNDCYETDSFIGEYCTEEEREILAREYYSEILSEAVALAPLQRGDKVLLVSIGKKYYAVPRQYAT